MIKSKKTGVYYNLLEDGDKVFYFTYNDINDNKKKKWVKVGKYSEGIRENRAFNLRAEQISLMKHGEDITVIANKKKKEIITLDGLAQIYFKDKNTTKDRIAKYETYIFPIFGMLNIENINKEKIKTFLNDIFLEEKAPFSKTLAVQNKINYNILLNEKSPQTVNGIRELFSSIINHNIKEHGLKYLNPCIGISKLKVDNDRERYLTVDEIKRLKDNIKDNFLLTLFIDLSLQTGGRLETILHIQKKDIDLSHGSVTLKNLKTNATYTGFLQDILINRLKEYLINLKVNDYVVSFENKHEVKLTSKNIQHRLKPVLDKLFNEGLSTRDSKNRIVIHTLRHTFASHLAINGTPIFTIQKLMNHKKIEQTLRYAKLAPDSGKNNVQGLYR